MNKSKGLIQFKICGKLADPKHNRSNTKLLNRYVSQNIEVFETDGIKLQCKLCKVSVPFHDKFVVEQHLKTKTHKDKHDQIIKKASNDVYTKHGSKGEESLVVLDKTKDFCRTCMGEFSKTKCFKQNINEIPAGFKNKTSIKELLQIIQPRIKVEIKNNLSIFLCSDCVQKLVVTYRFIEIYQNADNELHEMYQIFAMDDCNNISEVQQEFCRTCMKEFSKTKSFKLSINDIPTVCKSRKRIKELLRIIRPQIKVETKSNLSNFLCSDCVQKLIVAYKFIEMYQNADNELREMVEIFAMDKSNFVKEEQQQISNIIVANGNDITIISVEGLKDEMHENDNINNNSTYLKVEDQIMQEFSDDEENMMYVFSDPYSDASEEDSDDDWLPEQSWLNAIPKKENTNVSKDAFEEFFQPEENEDGSLSCQMCDSVLGTVELWREHMRHKHPEEKKNEQSKHVRKTEPNEDGFYPCEYCGKNCASYSNYRRHVRSHTVERQLCVECGKSFSLQSSYNNHLKRHRGEKTYKCPKCPKTFTCSSGLYSHRLTHMKEKPHVCDICGFAFHLGYQLKKHKYRHLGIRKYQCEFCDMKFGTRDNQRIHERTHTGEKPYGCKYCDKAFAQSYDCVKHLRQHLGKNVYQCELCPRRFPLVRDLRAHFASHKDDDEETRAANLKARKEEERKLKIKEIV